MIMLHCAEPSTGALGGGGRQGGLGVVAPVLEPLPLVDPEVPEVPGVVCVAPSVAPVESTLPVMLRHSPLVRPA